MLQNVETEQQIWDKDGNGNINLLICNPVFFGIQMWPLPSLPKSYSSVFTFLRLICQEQICENPFFRPAR